ncbi:hypothetical protein BY458DRAFT_458121 [Sporodiniella umbellata]|nr:hypothetical protein BY458DRAFT_458121 [Sporodiniella umbellata]
MVSCFIQKAAIFLTLYAAVLANKESELEQPQTLLGGVLKKPEKCGFKASASSDIKVHYRARAWGQEEFYENTYLREKPLEVTLGKGKLIKGIEEGIDGMCTGEVRRLLIPSYKAYGDLGIPNFVPPNTAVVVEVEVVEVISQFSNPWFWLSGIALCFVFYLYTQQQNMDARSSPGAFLAAQQKQSEKKDQ